jgi:hypothetical protein
LDNYVADHFIDLTNGSAVYTRGPIADTTLIFEHYPVDVPTPIEESAPAVENTTHGLRQSISGF